MGKQRFEETGRGSFWGDFLYEQVVPQDHFLHQLDRVIDWEAFGARLLALYEGQGEYGRPPYPPEALLKMLLLAYWFNLSEQQVEEWVNDSLAARCFLHLAANERAPDHSLCGMAALHLAGISDGAGAQPQAAGALADRCAVSRTCYRGGLTQGGVCLEE